MDAETMEYSLNQNVVFYGEEMLRGKLTDEEYAKVNGVKFTGKVVGHFSDYFIVKLDRTLSSGETSVLVDSRDCKPLNCYWCMDAKKVAVTPFTIQQYETNTIPTMPCQECCRGEFMKWMEERTACA